MTNEELKEIREIHNLTKGEFAKLLNVTPMLYGRYESGSLEIPEEIVVKIGEISNTTISAIENAGKKRKQRVSKKGTTSAAAAVTSAEAPSTEAPGSFDEKALVRVPQEDKANVEVVIESLMGGQITVDEVIEKVRRVAGDGPAKVYVKPEENRAYFVTETISGAVYLW